MGFIDDYKITLQNTLAKGDFVQARELVQGFHRTNLPYDAELFYLEAVLCYYEAHYPLAAFWARSGYEHFPDYAPFKELLSLLANPGVDYNAYVPQPTFDCSFLNKRLRIVIYENVIPLMDYTAEQFRKTFELLGHDIFIFHHNDFETSSKELLEFGKAGIDFVLLFNNMGALIRSDASHNLWEQYRIPCINYLFDHPLYYADYISQMPETCIITCVDNNHVSYLKRFFPNIRHSFFFPLGGEYIEQELIPFKERPIDALYVGSLKTAEQLPDSILTEKIIQYLFSHPSATTETAIELCLTAIYRANLSNGNIPETLNQLQDFAIMSGNYQADDTVVPQALLQEVLFTYRYIDMHVNAHYREELISRLVKSGIHVTVYGNGWEQTDLFNYPCFHYGGIISQTECIKQMYQSKIVLNSMPWFKDGAHDRIFNAMLCHAVCVTDESNYLTKQFKDQQDIIYYRLDQMEQLPHIVRTILDSPDKADAIAENGYQKAILAHNWETRSLELLTRFMQSDFK